MSTVGDLQRKASRERRVSREAALAAGRRAADRVRPRVSRSFDVSID
jgi:hypothetical protein